MFLSCILCDISVNSLSNTMLHFFLCPQGAAWNTCDVQEGSSVAVFGLGAVGLAIVQAAKTRGAKRIFAIDVNEGKFALATQLGATDVVNPSKLGEHIEHWRAVCIASCAD